MEVAKFDVPKRLKCTMVETICFKLHNNLINTTNNFGNSFV